MSVAGILASSLFSTPALQAAQKVAGWTSSIVNDLGSDLKSGNPSGAHSVYGVVHRNLALQSSNSESDTSLSGNILQLGQNIKSGDIPAAQADLSRIHQVLSRIAHPHTQPISIEDGSSLSSANSLTDPLLAVLQAYGSMQQASFNGALSNSLATNAGTFSIDA